MTTIDGFIDKCIKAFETEFADRANEEAKNLYNEDPNYFDNVQDVDTIGDIVEEYVMSNDRIRYDYIRDTAESIALKLLKRENAKFFREFIKSYDIDYIRENFRYSGIDYEIDDNGNPVNDSELEDIAEYVMQCVEFSTLYPFEEGLVTDAENVFMDLMIHYLI